MQTSLFRMSDESKPRVWQVMNRKINPLFMGQLH